jgi:hypothetical protein
MEDCEDVRFKHDADIECLTAEKISPVDIHRRMQTVYGDKCVDLNTVRRWVQQVKQDELVEADVLGERKRHFKDRIQKLVERWQKCIEDGRCYVEKMFMHSCK